MTNNWILRWGRSSQPEQRLFCFPFAGGGAYYYKPWAERLPASIEVCGVQLPGRENKHAEAPLTSMSILLPILAQMIAPLMTIPCSFFGHSMGGLIAFELSRYLRSQNYSEPEHLFISATTAAQLPRHRPPLHLMSDSELKQELISYGGTPQAVLDDQDMVSMMLRLLRADCTLFETYDYVPQPPVACPITVLGSLEDTRTSEAELRSWQQQTSSTFAMHTFPGGHFYLKDNKHRDSLLQLIGRVLAHHE